MVIIPAGSFMMGSPQDEKGRRSVEEPMHRVSFDQQFAIGRYPITFKEYDHFCAETGRDLRKDGGWGRGRRPVIEVSHREAEDYCFWLSKMTGETYRLPSEAEWEYACRATSTDAYVYGHSISRTQANFDPFVRQTTRVGDFPANPWGLFDMHGNVWEWCADFWNDSYEGAPEDGSPWLSGDPTLRVMRGGSWSDSPENVRSAMRASNTTDHRNNNLGFRVVRELYRRFVNA